MKINKTNNTTVVLNDFYRIPIDHFEDKIKYDSRLNDLINTISPNKNKFLEYMKTSNISITKNCVPFMSKALMYGEIKLGKDLIDFTRAEIKEMFLRMSKDKLFTSRGQYDTAMALIQQYTMWGFEQNPRLCTEIITAKDFNFGYQDLVDKSAVENQMLTNNEMNFIIPMLESPMNEIALVLGREGFEFKDVIDLKIDTVKSAKNRVFKIGDRQIGISEAAYDKLLSVCAETHSSRRFKGGTVKAMPLAETGYVIRYYKNKRSQGAVNPTVFSNNISKDLLNSCFITSSFKDIRISSILNDYLDGMNFEDVKHKYGLKFPNELLFNSNYKLKLKILKLKRQIEKRG